MHTYTHTYAHTHLHASQYMDHVSFNPPHLVNVAKRGAGVATSPAGGHQYAINRYTVEVGKLSSVVVSW